MLPDCLGATEVVEMLARSARELRVAASELDALDAKIGDGDSGSSLAALFEGSVDECHL